MAIDVLIVGGSFAGLAAALQIARARRNVVVLDSGQPRNHRTSEVHGFFGQDGKSPKQILNETRDQLNAYPTFHYCEQEALCANTVANYFEVSLSSGQILTAKRLILATGVVDRLPLIIGIAERWGKTVLHCVYCHGYEVRDKRLGILALNSTSLNTAMLLPDWGPTTVFTQGVSELDSFRAEAFKARGIVLETEPIVALTGNPPEIESALLRDGRQVSIDALFVNPSTQLSSTLAADLGCLLGEGLFGPFIQTNDSRATSVFGVYAAGDAVRSGHTVTWAVSDGATAGIAAHQSLAWNPLAQ